MSKFQPKSTIESSNFNDENPLFVRNLKISMKFGRTIWRKSILFNEASQKIHRIYGMDLYGGWTSGFSEFYAVVWSLERRSQARDIARATQPELSTRFTDGFFNLEASLSRGQFERTKEAVDSGENWPSLSVPLPPSPCRTNNSGARMKISRPTPWPARISGYHENIPRRCRGYWDFSLPF